MEYFWEIVLPRRW